MTDQDNSVVAARFRAAFLEWAFMTDDEIESFVYLSKLDYEMRHGDGQNPGTLSERFWMSVAILFGSDRYKKIRDASCVIKRRIVDEYKSPTKH